MVLALGTLSPVNAQADEQAAPAGNETSPAGQGSGETTLSAYMKTFKVDREQALEGLERQYEALPILERIVALAGDQLISVGLERNPDVSIKAIVAPGAPTKEIRAVLDRAAVPAALVQRTGPAQAEMVATVDENYDDWRDRYPALGGIAILPEKGAIEVSLTKTTDARAQVIVDDLATTPGLEQLDVRYVIRQTAAADGQVAGYRLRKPDHSPECTEGFSVVHIATGTRGVTTSGHCANDLRWNPWDWFGLHSLTFQAQQRTESRDVQWHTTAGGFETPSSFSLTWDTYTLEPVVDSIPQSSMVGMFLCHVGASTEFSCGTVDSITYRPDRICGADGQSTCAANWVRMAGPELSCYYGDSGGPVFFEWFGNIHAAGLYKGQLVISSTSCNLPNFFMIFMAVRKIDGLGLKLLIY